MWRWQRLQMPSDMKGVSLLSLSPPAEIKGLDPHRQLFTIYPLLCVREYAVYARICILHIKTGFSAGLGFCNLEVKSQDGSSGRRVRNMNFVVSAPTGSITSFKVTNSLPSLTFEQALPPLKSDTIWTRSIFSLSLDSRAPWITACILECIRDGQRPKCL